MDIEMVLTIIAEDRPGLVEEVARVVADHGGNWVDSAMSRLGGEFAGILRVTIARQRAAELEAAFEALEENGVHTHIRRGASGAVSEGRTAYVEVVGQDHKGIVRDISHVFASNSVNVNELRTHVFDGSMTGEHMFSAEADIVLPDGLEMGELCEKLEDIASDLMIDIRMCGVKGE